MRLTCRCNEETASGGEEPKESQASGPGLAGMAGLHFTCLLDPSRHGCFSWHEVVTELFLIIITVMIENTQMLL